MKAEASELRVDSDGLQKRSVGHKDYLEDSWDLVSMVISTLRGVISNYKYSYLNYNPSY